MNIMRKDDFVLAELLLLASRLEVQVRREKLGDTEAPAHSGLAFIEGRPVIFLDRQLQPDEAVDVMARELIKFRMDDIYLKPAIRKLFENTPANSEEE